jgi:hypothetical protein
MSDYCLHGVRTKYPCISCHMAENARLRAENAALRKIVTAAAEFSDHTSWYAVNALVVGARKTLRKFASNATDGVPVDRPSPG